MRQPLESFFRKALIERIFPFAIAMMLSASCMFAEGLAGRWDAVATVGSLKIPFTLFFDGKGETFSASLVKGQGRIAASSSSFDGQILRAEFGPAGGHLEAVLKDGDLKGVFGSEKTGKHPFQATAFCTCGFVGEAGPDISGVWESREDQWRLSVKRVGEDTVALIARGGKEIGPLVGRFNGTFFELSFFDGHEGGVLEIEPQNDSLLALSWMEPGAPAKKLKAARLAAQQR